MKLEYKNLGSVDADELVAELQQWQGELDDSVEDEIKFNVLDIVIDMIVQGAN